MGLDVTAYSHLRHVEHEKSEWYCNLETEDGDLEHITVFSYASFPRSYAGLAKDDQIFTVGTSKFVGGVCYVETEQTGIKGFCAGSYSGYGKFRGALAKSVGIEDIEKFWESPDYDKPFAEIVNFADNEGCIGPIAAADLHRDFIEQRFAFVESLMDLPEHEASYFTRVYDHFAAACELASADGMTRFH